MGNQMFQFAGGYAIAKRLGYDFGLLQGNQIKCFDVSEFVTDYRPEREVEMMSMGYCGDVFVEDDTYIKCYFQSEKYFLEVEDDIRRMFTFRELEPVRPSGNVCSVHVRRGDYLTRGAKALYCMADGYFHCAMKIMRERMNGVRFLVFSDDMPWCVENLGADDVSYSTGYTCQHDLLNMASCDAHIIANSTYSWWASWLSGRLTIAPDKWLKKTDSRDIYCSDWMVIGAEVV